MNTHRTSSKAIITLFLVIGICFLILTAAAAAAARDAATVGRGSRTGVLRVDFVDSSGRITHQQSVDVSGASRWMSPKSTPIKLRNTGTIAAAYTISADLETTGDHSLDDVPIATVTNDAGQTLYQGRLSGLTLTESHLEPGLATTYWLHITWPSTAGDIASQGRSLSFLLLANPTPAEG